MSNKAINRFLAECQERIGKYSNSELINLYHLEKSINRPFKEKNT